MLRVSSAASPGYQIFMLVLCFYSLGILAFQATGPSEPGTTTILEYADLLVCMIFFGDFVFSLARAEDRWRYFRTWGWIDLLSSIPAVDVLRWGRAARILRVFRVLRGLRAAHLLVGLIMKRRAENAILAVSLIAIVLLTFCSIAVLYFESGSDANIRSAEDALWWAITTMTTVGYGDRFPITTEGRMVAVLLMGAGVGLFGVFSGFLASWFMGEDDSSKKNEIAELKEEVVRLRAALERNG